MPALDAYHVGEFVVTKVGYVACLLLPGIPHDGVGEVVLLHAHLPAGHDVRDDMLRLRVLVDPVGPFAHRHDVAAFLEDLVVPGLRIRTKRLEKHGVWRAIYDNLEFNELSFVRASLENP